MSILVVITVFTLMLVTGFMAYEYGIEVGKRTPLSKLRKQIEEEDDESAAERYMRRRAYEER